MSATLVRQLFELQIIQGEAYISKFESRTTKKRVIKSTRGNIYDRNGEELATNVLAYSVTFEDNGTYDSTREKNLTLNGIAYKVLKILESNGDSISTGFHIVLDESGNYAFDVDEGFTLNRFRADIYGEPLIDNLTKKQKNATADQMIEFMSGKEGFSIVLYGDNAYTKEELTSHGLPENLSKQDILELSKIRYALVICCSTTVNIITLACQFKRIITPVATYRYNIQMSGDTNNLITLAHLCITTAYFLISSS